MATGFRLWFFEVNWKLIPSYRSKETMLALAISFDQTTRGQIIETNDGTELVAKNWPQDSETQLIAFSSRGNRADVVYPTEVAEDIARLGRLKKQNRVISKSKPDWFKRLEHYGSHLLTTLFSCFEVQSPIVL